MARIAGKDNAADVLTKFVSREDLDRHCPVLASLRQRSEQPESLSGERLDGLGPRESVRQNRITSSDDDWLQ